MDVICSPAAVTSPAANFSNVNGHLILHHFGSRQTQNTHDSFNYLELITFPLRIFLHFRGFVSAIAASVAIAAANKLIAEVGIVGFEMAGQK